MNRKGFTLIELLIVVVIIGILAAIAIPKFANTKEKAYLASMKSDLRNLITRGQRLHSRRRSLGLRGPHRRALESVCDGRRGNSGLESGRTIGEWSLARVRRPILAC